MSISNKVWAIIGGAAALVIVPAGVAMATIAVHDDFRPGISRLVPERPGPAVVPGGMRGPMFGDQDRTQARDGSYCDGDGPRGRDNLDDRRGGRMTGGYGQGMMDGSGPRDN